MDRTKPIVALDYATKDEAIKFLNQFPNEQLNVKIGMELFYSGGNDFIDEVNKRGHEIFLDLKLHDIPNTVKSAMKVLARMQVAMVNVHAAGGGAMMKAAKEGLIEGTPKGQKRPIIIAVTQLTSTTQEQLEKEQLVHATIEESVLNYAKLAHESGLDGIVCSPLEAESIRKKISDDFYTVTPGVRLEKNLVKSDDQHRIATPYTAALDGSHYIVVGRPITQATDAVAAYEEVKTGWQKGLAERKGA